MAPVRLALKPADILAAGGMEAGNRRDRHPGRELRLAIGRSYGLRSASGGDAAGDRR